MNEATRVADLVRKAVDEGANTAEEIHRAVADLPLSALEQLEIFPATVKDVRQVQERSIGAVYDLIRGVNREVNQLATDLLEGPKSRKHPKRAAKRPAKKKAARAA